MKKLLSYKAASVIGILLTQSLFSADVFAGNKAPNMGVSIGSTSIAGSLGDARNSANSTDFITISDSGSIIFISARNAAGQSKSCATSNPLLMTQIRSANSDAFLFVNIDTLGNCTSISVHNSSVRQPKAL